jgi:hypothetical protein
MRNIKRFNEARLVLPSVKDTSILDDIEHIFATLIEDYDPEVCEYATGVTVLKFKKQDCIVCSTVEEYHLAVQKQSHLVDSIIDCIDKLKIHVPDLATRLDNGSDNYHRESKNEFRVYLGSKECADVISMMI